MTDPTLQALCEAARAADLDAVRRLLPATADIDALDAHGMNALHCAAVACGGADPGASLEVMRALLQAGATPDLPAADGRTALYFAAEYSSTLDPVRLLLEAGANPDVADRFGNHIIVNAFADETRSLLARLTGRPVPPPPLRLPLVKLDAAQWRAARQRLDVVFDALTAAGLIALQDIGTTQADAFSDCTEALEARGGLAAGISGFCFYTRQDRDRARRSSALALGVWAAPDGNDAATTRIGQSIVDIFRAHGFAVDWSGSPRTRPIVYLHAGAGATGGRET